MMRRTQATLLLAATAALLALAPASPALAQGSAPAGDATKDATTMLYNAGIDAAKNEQWDKAYENFHAAWKIKQHPQIAVNLGRAALKTGRPLEAAEYLAFFLRETKEQVDNQDRAAVQKLLLEAKGKIGTLIVKVHKPGAEVVVDGRVVGQAPLSREVFVDAGSHTVEARLGKERAELLTVELKAGDSRQVGLTFGGARGGAGDGEPSGGAPEQGGAPEAEEKPDDGRTRRIVIGVGIGLSVVAAATGGVFTTLTFLKQGERDKECGETCSSYDAQDRWKKLEMEKRSFRDVAVGTFGAAVALGTATIVYAAVTGQKSDAPVQAGVLVAPGMGGVTVQGRW